MLLVDASRTNQKPGNTTYVGTLTQLHFRVFRPYKRMLCATDCITFSTF
jgi:hypothetical protein